MTTTKKSSVKKKKAPSPPRKKMGRHTKYDPDIHPIKAWILAISGKINKEIAAGLRISTKTLHAWCKKYPDFLSAIKGGKEVADAKVEKALYKRAIGYKVPEKKIIQMPDGTVRKEVVEKEIVPDVIAQKFWLTNRLPNDWKDRVDHKIGGEGGEPILVKIIKAVSMEDI
jgi:hypothetical protein